MTKRTRIAYLLVDSSGISLGDPKSECSKRAIYSGSGTNYFDYFKLHEAIMATSSRGDK